MGREKRGSALLPLTTQVEPAGPENLVGSDTPRAGGSSRARMGPSRGPQLVRKGPEGVGGSGASSGRDSTIIGVGSPEGGCAAPLPQRARKPQERSAGALANGTGGWE